jgi:hypothetical protein
MASPHVALVYPPTCDPTAPYLAVPMLTGFLRAHGVRVTPIDANLEAYDQLLRGDAMSALARRVERSIGELERQKRLGHQEQLRYLALLRARGDARLAKAAIDEATATLRDEARFFDPIAYDAATRTIDAALRAVSAAHFPTQLDFTAYRTPFGMLSHDEIQRAASPEQDPFFGYVQDTLIPRLRAAAPDVIGLSVCFPGQLQPAYAFAWKIKAALPGVHLTVGGPGVTQMLIRLEGTALAQALGPFDSAVVYEGERPLLALAERVAAKASLRELTNVVLRDPLRGARFLAGHGMEDLKGLPAPDFDGLPLERYFAPRLTLPYDPTRGCYWGKCTFCHYGLAEVGTASYRERNVADAVAHLRALSQKHGTKHFYLSQDSVAPKTIVKLAQAIADAGLDVRWGTDLKAEKYLTPERAEILRRGGAVACAIGVETANDRVLELIDKGAPVSVVTDAAVRLDRAGVAAEAMCFTDFPTESAAEAHDTLRWIAEHRASLAVYIVGEFGLTHGALVAHAPKKFGIAETWQLEGDAFGLSLFYAPKKPWKTEAERSALDASLRELSRGWTLRTYPWAGAVSTAHTLLYYDRLGRDCFKRLADQQAYAGRLGRAFVGTAAFDPGALEEAELFEAEIWQTLVHEERAVSRARYEALAATRRPLRPKSVPMRFAPERSPEKMRAPGRRPSHATSSATAASRNAPKA